MLGFLAGVLSGINSASAQVIPDGSVPTTVTSPNARDFTIDGGARSGGNLFHSFSQFSVPTGGSAFFNNGLDVQNIFARVTGGTASNIDGLIKANGTASLFLLNPSGILFGPNASLNLGGSFIGTTANSVKFADGTEFSAVNSNHSPLLTMSAPIGLQMGSNPGNIQVNGSGHTLKHAPSFLGPATRNPSIKGLRVQPGNTLALIGNGIQLTGGVLLAESGHVELGSGQAGTVALDTTTSRWTFDYTSLPTLADIRLSQAALVDASGSPGGSIHLQGQTVQLQDSSIVMVQQRGSQNALGGIEVNADLLELGGVLPNRDPSLILSENLGRGQGNHIEVSARQIVARDGGRLITTTFRNGGAGGNLTVNATESIDLSGYSPLDVAATSGIITPSNAGAGKGGDLIVNTSDLMLRDGAVISSSVFGGQGGGTVNIDAEQISLIGENKGTGVGSVIATTSFWGGASKTINIQTGRLLLKAGGVISASTSGSSNAGSLTIKASESIEIDGAGSVLSERSRIIASGQNPPGRLQQIFGLPPLPSGNAGNLSITAPSIQVRNQGYIAAENVGSGDAGSLILNANEIILDQQGQIKTSTIVGQGGNMTITARDILLLRHNSFMSAKAGGKGNGGNIAIFSPIILGLENSDIIANAVKGRGGNINITTQGILGLKYRNRLTPENDITASSKFGVNGIVKVNTIGTDPGAGLTEFLVNVFDPSQKIATGCSTTQGSQFVATGRGGIPQNPSQQVVSDHTWNDVRDLSAYRGHSGTVAASPATSSTLVQASRFQRNADGSIELVASSTPVPVAAIATCAGSAMTTVATKTRSS
ncbi:filamentous hemagglutinin N-terminal domain-containing protein [Alkalinema sp. FACHB-956]|nr:filamentous hemagglutinin N-terminal domain-containing protein [Alkalinema sp. FACHB-956]